MAKKIQTPATDLPPDVTAADLKWPKFGENGGDGEQLNQSELKALGLGYETNWPGTFEFYRTERFGWVLTTLLISSGRRRGTTDRSYGVTVKDGSLVTVGRGPHVLATATVYLSKVNAARLARYVELWKKGMAKAGDTRDRISTRRANTIARRAGPWNMPWDA